LILSSRGLNMTTVGIFEAKNRLSELIDRAARGDVIVITRRGEQVARLLPPETPDAARSARTLAERIRLSRTRATLGEGVSLRELIDEGRR
jgi:prevent-host-death family protein